MRRRRIRFEEIPPAFIKVITIQIASRSLIIASSKSVFDHLLRSAFTTKALTVCNLFSSRPIPSTRWLAIKIAILDEMSRKDQ